MLITVAIMYFYYHLYNQLLNIWTLIYFGTQILQNTSIFRKNNFSLFERPDFSNTYCSTFPAFVIYE